MNRTICRAAIAVGGWAEIEAIRLARKSPARVTFNVRSAAVLAESALSETRASLIAELTPDARMMANTAPHAPRLAPVELTPAKRRTFHKATQKACPCRLCALALNPPRTFEEMARFGLDSIGAESASLWEVSNTSAANLAAHEAERSKGREPKSDV